MSEVNAANQIDVIDSAAPVAPVAPDQNADPVERIRDLEARLTKEGRTKAQVQAESNSLKQQLQAVQADVESKAEQIQRFEEWYFKNAATPAEKAAREQQTVSQGQTEAQKAKASAATWKAIAEEENPIVKTALRAAADKGEFYSTRQITSLRETLANLSVQTVEEPEPPKIGAHRTTGTRAGLDEQIAEAKKTKNIPLLLNLQAEKQKAIKAPGL